MDFENEESKIIVVGTCYDMCPEVERRKRENENDIHKLESPFFYTDVLQLDNQEELTFKHTMIKKFQRSSADHELQIAEMLRTPETLLQTIQYIEDYVMSLVDRNIDLHQGDSVTVNLFVYLFIWDRYRMIAKDFTLQQSALELTPMWIECHERMARWFIYQDHAMKSQSDFVSGHAQQNGEQLNNLLKSLQTFYQNAHHRFHDPNTVNNNQNYTSQDYLAHEAEFIAYFILFQIGNAGEITKFLQKLSTTLLQTKEIKFAIEVWSSILTDNYAKFFHLLRHKSNILQACLMHRYVGRMRLNGLRKLSRSFPPSKNSKASIDIHYFTNLFCFEEDEQTVAFLEHCGFHFKLNDDQQMVVELETITLEDYMPQDKNGHPIYPIVPHLTYIIDANKRIKDDDGHLYSIQDICRGFATVVEPVTSTITTPNITNNTTNNVINGRGKSPLPTMNTPLPASSGIDSTQTNSMLKANKDKWLIPKKKVVDPSSDRSALLSGSLSSSREPVKPPSPKVKQSPQTKPQPPQPPQPTQQQPAKFQFQAKETPAATTPQQPFKSQASSNDTNKTFVFSPPAPPATNQQKISNPFAASNPPQTNQFNSVSAKDAFPSLPQAPAPSSNNQSWKTPTSNKQEIPAVTPMNFPSYQSTPAAGPFSTAKQTPGQSLPFSPPNNNWMSTPGTTTTTPITPGAALTPSTFNTFSSSSLQIQPPVEDSPASKGFEASYQPTKQQGRLSDQFNSKQTPYKPRTPQFTSPDTTKTPSRSYHESPRSAYKETSTTTPTNTQTTPSNQPSSQSKPRKQLATKDIKRLKTFIQGRQRKLTQFFLQNAFQMWKVWILQTENNGKALILKNSMKKWKIIYKFMKIQRHKFLESMKDINTIPATPLPIPLVSSEIQCKQILENNRNLKASNQGIPSFYCPIDYIPSSDLLFNIPIPDPFPVDFPRRDILLISSSQEAGYYHVQHDCPLISTFRHLLTSASGNQLPLPLSLSEKSFQPLYQCQQRTNSSDYELNIYETTFQTLARTTSTSSLTGIQAILLFNSNFQQFFSNQSNPSLPKTLATSGKNIPIYAINVFYYEVEINEKISIEHFSHFPTLTLTSLPETGPLSSLQTFLQTISTTFTPQMTIVGSSLILIPIVKQQKDLWKSQFTLHRHVSIPLSQYHLMDSDMNQILQSDLQYSMSFVWTTIPSFPLIRKVSLLDWISWHILSYYGHISLTNSSLNEIKSSQQCINDQQIITFFNSFKQILYLFQQNQIESQLSYLQQLQQYFPIGLQTYSTNETSSSSFPSNEQTSFQHSLSYIHHMCTKLIDKLQSIFTIKDSFSILWLETNWKQIWQSLLNEIALPLIPKEMKEEEFVRYSYVWSYCYEFNWEFTSFYSDCQRIEEFIQCFESKLCIFLQYYLTLCVSKGSIEQWLIFPKLSVTCDAYDGDMLPPSPLSSVPMPSFAHLKKQKEHALLEYDLRDQYALIDEKMKRRRLNEPLLLTSFSSFSALTTSSPLGKKASPHSSSTVKKQRFMHEDIDGIDMNYLTQTPLTSSLRSTNKTNTTNTPRSSLRSLFVLTNPEEESDLPEEEQEESSLNSLDQFTQLLQSIQQEKQLNKQNIQSYQQTLYDYLK